MAYTFLFILSLASISEARNIVIIRDVTSSYPYLASADSLVEAQVIPNLGPGDQFFVIDLGNFSTDRVRSITYPAIPAGGPIPKSIMGWKREQRKRTLLWKEADKQEVKSQKILRSSVQKGGRTMLHELLGYVSTLTTTGDYIILYSDLQDTQQEKTSMPPKASYDFRGTHVRFIYVPYDNYNTWTKLTKAWNKYFQETDSFQLLDPVKSQISTLLPTHPLSREIQRP